MRGHGDGRRWLTLALVCGVSAHATIAARPQWPFGLFGSQTSFFSDAERHLMAPYQARLEASAAQLPAQAPLTALLQPVLRLAAERGSTGDPTVENRGALLALALFLNAEDAAAFLPETRDFPRPGARRFLLAGRTDLAKHFVVSAAVTAAAGVPAAAALGLYKELSDARGGSGFSFVDLAADRAGATFGQVATASTRSARQLHAQMQRGVTEAQFMPAIAGLPENLSDAEFTRRYRGARAAAYDALVTDIDRRIAALPLFNAP